MTTVLLVEDNNDNARALARLLGRRGYTVTIAASGRDALEMARTELPAVILMDVGLPDIDGLEVTRRLKADPATAAVPIVALTAHAMSEDRRAAMAAGCDDFSAKPVNLQDLLARMAAVLGQQPGAGPDP